MKRKKINPFLSTFLIATSCALALRLFIVEDYRILSNSMQPNLMDGDLVFASKAYYSLRVPFTAVELIQFSSPKRGDVVVLTPPKHAHTLAKRVVAVGGDTVKIENGVLKLNDKQVGYVPIGEKQATETVGDVSYSIIPDKKNNFGPIVVPDNHVFVLGDNRPESRDSRHWGPIPNVYLEGRLSFVWLSLQKDGHLRLSRVGRWVHP